MVDCRLSWSEMAPDTVANPVDRLSPAVLTRTREYAGKSRSSADSNVQVQVFTDGQQSFETTMLSVCMERFNPVSAQFPQQSCPALADTPPRVVKKQTSRTRETNLYVWRYRFMVFSLNSHEKIELICDSVKPKVESIVTFCNNYNKDKFRRGILKGRKCHYVASVGW